MKRRLSLAPVALSLIIFGISLLLSPHVPLDKQQGSAQPLGSEESISGQTFSPDFDLSKIEEEILGEEKAQEDLVLVTKVVDGDTIEIESGQRVRYIGIDTPETVDPRKPVQCFGKEAFRQNKKLVEGKRVRLEKDVSDTDKYDRLLRYIWVDDKLVNEVLVQEGYAYSSPYPPDIKYQDRFDKVQTLAQKEGRGLWGSCSVAGIANTSSQNKSQSNSCEIKGNISSSGEKIYHLPNQRYYNKTAIDENKGERWFCSEKEAQSAGWRKSKV